MAFPLQEPLQAFAGYQDAFVTVLNADASALIVSTYRGGQGNDRGFGIAVDGVGAVYIVGGTTSVDFPILEAYQPSLAGHADAFVTKLALARRYDFECAAKLVCGRQEEADNLALVRGVYGTTVNIHNPNREPARFAKKLALSIPPMDQRPGQLGHLHGSFQRDRR